MTLDRSVMNVSIGAVAKDVGTTVTGIQGAITAYTLVMASLMITGAKVARSSAASGRSPDDPAGPAETLAMCRWLAYSGSPIQLEALLVKRDRSLNDQSLHARQGATTTDGPGACSRHVPPAAA
jgi:hypothetical protein